MKTSENLTNIAKALVAIQGEIKGITKNAQGHGYKYITFDAIITLVKPVLTKHGVFLIQNVKGDIVDGQNLAYCETRLLHESGEWIESDTLIIKPVSVKAGAPTTPRDMGSAITYGKRYQLCGMLGISADVDDDAAVASNKDKWGLIITQEQKALISKTLIPKKGITKEMFSNLVVKVAGCVKDYKTLTVEEGSELIALMNELPDVENRAVAQ